ncbi:MAG: hypothetical protein ACTS4T_00515 [Candidatus Hodgkinia cicadicola]
MFSLCKAATKVLRWKSEGNVTEGQLVEGIVKFKTEVGALIDIGRTSFGVLPNFGSWSFQQLKVGDFVKTYVEEVGSPPNEFYLSRRHLDEEDAWSAVLGAWRTFVTVEAEVVAPTFGGVEMRVFGLPAGLIWDSKTAERVWNFAAGVVVPVKITSAARDLKLIILSSAGDVNGSLGDFKFNKSVWGKIIEPLPRGYYLNVCGLPAVLTFEGVPWWESLRFSEVAQHQQLVLVNVRKRRLMHIERGWSVAELVRMSLRIVDEMDLADKELTFGSEVGAVILPPNELNVSPRERYFDAKEIEQLNREWAIADQDWKQGLKRGWLRTSEELSVRKCGSSFLPPKGFYETNRSFPSEVKSDVNELNRSAEVEAISLLRERSFAQMNRLGFKGDALTCEREQTNWMEFVKSEVEGASSAVGEVKRPPKVDGTFNEGDWDENEMYCDEGEYEDELSNFEYESLDFAGEVERKCESSEGIDDFTFEGKLIRNWRNELNVDKLRESADKVFSGSRREQQMLEVTLAGKHFGRPSRSIRPIYGVITGLDLQSGLIIMQSANDIVTLITEASFTSDDTYLFEKNATFGSGAIKILPVAFCPFVTSVVVEIDVDGFRLLKWIEEYGFGPFVGSVVKIETDGFVIALHEDIYGRLSAQGDHFDERDCINAEVLVSVCDVNVATNTLNLEFVEDEEDRTILEEID